MVREITGMGQLQFAGLGEVAPRNRGYIADIKSDIESGILTDLPWICREFRRQGNVILPDSGISQMRRGTLSRPEVEAVCWGFTARFWNFWTTHHRCSKKGYSSGESGLSGALAGDDGSRPFSPSRISRSCGENSSLTCWLSRNAWRWSGGRSRR